MQLFDSIDEIRAVISEKRRQGATVGLVPTMGALHEGHLSLVNTARACDVVVVSIFVNPLQFNNASDLRDYPRTLDQDLDTLSNECDMVFAPTQEVVYFDSPVSRIDFGNNEKKLEGKFRSGHFSGIGMIVTKLLNIIQPDYVYFGLKDFQQFLLVKQLVKDFSFQVQVIGCPTIREESGLALSSRNANLSEEGKRVAPKIFEGLNIVKNKFDAGATLEKAKKEASLFYDFFDNIKIEYLECMSNGLEVMEEFNDKGEIIVCIAASIDGIRLIDNLYLRHGG